MADHASDITWQYVPDEGCYITVGDNVLDDMLMAMMESGIPMPLVQTPENDADVQAIVAALRRMAARLSESVSP